MNRNLTATSPTMMNDTTPTRNTSPTSVFKLHPVMLDVNDNKDRLPPTKHNDSTTDFCPISTLEKDPSLDSLVILKQASNTSQKTSRRVSFHDSSQTLEESDKWDDFNVSQEICEFHPNDAPVNIRNPDWIPEEYDQVPWYKDHEPWWQGLELEQQDDNDEQQDGFTRLCRLIIQATHEEEKEKRGKTVVAAEPNALSAAAAAVAAATGETPRARKSLVRRTYNNTTPKYGGRRSSLDDTLHRVALASSSSLSSSSTTTSSSLDDTQHRQSVSSRLRALDLQEKDGDEDDDDSSSYCSSSSSSSDASSSSLDSSTAPPNTMTTATESNTAATPDLSHNPSSVDNTLDRRYHAPEQQPTTFTTTTNHRHSERTCFVKYHREIYPIQVDLEAPVATLKQQLQTKLHVSATIQDMQVSYDGMRHPLQDDKTLHYYGISGGGFFTLSHT